MSYYSSIYGLRIRLNAQVPGIAVENSTHIPTDVQIIFGTMPSWLRSKEHGKQVWYVSPEWEQGESPRLIVWYFPEDEHFQIKYGDGTEFLIDKAGTQIWATWPYQTLTVEDTATYLLGPVMGFVLLLRGCISLHASAIAIDNYAVALVGPAGAGKSTTAAALANLGYCILTEDVVTLQDFGSSFLVQPAYPLIRLWPCSVKALYGEEAELPKLTPTWDKRYLDLTSEQYRFQKNPLPLAALYVLDERKSDPSFPLVREMSPSDGLLSLIAHTYTNYLMDKTMRARGFQLLGRVCQRVPVRKVIPHADPQYIPALCTTIIRDFDKIQSSTAP